MALALGFLFVAGGSSCSVAREGSPHSASADSRAVTAGVAGAASVTGIACVLQAPAQVRLVEPVVPLTFMLRNDGTQDVRVLARQTPIEGVLADMFEITQAGRRIDYRGPMVKRGPPGEAEFFTLAPGAHARATIDLLAGYDLTARGTYRVRFIRTDEFTCNELLIERN